MILDTYRESLAAVGGELCSFSRKQESDSCFPVYQRTQCINLTKKHLHKPKDDRTGGKELGSRFKRLVFLRVESHLK